MSATVYDELIEAGASPLPDDWFYRIREHEPSINGYGYYTVSIRRRHKIGSTLVNDGIYNFRSWRQKMAEDEKCPDDPTDAQVFASMCNGLAHEVLKRRNAVDRAGVLRRFVGDHP